MAVSFVFHWSMDVSSEDQVGGRDERAGFWEQSPERASPEGGKACRGAANIPRTRDGDSLCPVEVETSPPQPDEVVRALQAALAEPRPEPDPWWRAGVEEALGE